jgi:murein hydrolase activator
MRKSVILSVAALLWASALTAEEGPGVMAQKASDQLAEAAIQLAGAASSKDRIAALTQTVRAYESGLAAMREGLRQAALAERSIRAKFEREDAQMAEVVSLLGTVSQAPEIGSVLHPSGALATARATILTAALMPALQERSAALAGDLKDLNALIAVQSAGIETLQEGLDDIRSARLLLATAISERSELPQTVATDDAAMEALINSAETLSAFANNLVPEKSFPLNTAIRQWPMPVNGRVIRRYDEADAAGVRRPGWVIATEPQALVTAPTSATVRFSGDFPGLGQVVIVEPAAGQLLILAGLGQNFAERGQIVSAGDPIGLMGGTARGEQEKLIETSLLSGQPGGETLYMEIRQGQSPVDPASYLGPDEE